MNIQRIVCPVGKSEESFYAVPTAVRLAECWGAELILLHLDPDFLSRKEMTMLRVSPQEMEKQMAESAQKERQILMEQVKKLGLEGKISRIILREGSKDHDIPREAEELGADLLVIHTSGYNTLWEKTAGSTAASILRHSHISVFILVRPST
ncbi:MAG: universal stress protein [bacterium]